MIAKKWCNRGGHYKTTVKVGVLLSYDKSITTFDKVLVALWALWKSGMTYGLRGGYYKIASQIKRFFARMDLNENYQLDATN